MRKRYGINNVMGYNMKEAENAQHTPEQSERWRIHIDSTGTTYLMVGSEIVGEMLGHSDQKDCDARRIVACVNACAGIANPEIKIPQLQHALIDAVEQLQVAEQQREDLIHWIIAAIGELKTCGTGMQISIMVATLEEVVAKARGQQ